MIANYNHDCPCGKGTAPEWRLDDCREIGWHCNACGETMPGEPDGYRPDLDPVFVHTKIGAVLADLHNADFVYVSNGDHGDDIAATVAERCAATGRYSQRAILRFIAEEMDCDYLDQQGAQIRAGNDPRRRCSCGELATSFCGDKAQCSDCWGLEEKPF